MAVDPREMGTVELRKVRGDSLLRLFVNGVSEGNADAVALEANGNGRNVHANLERQQAC